MLHPRVSVSAMCTFPWPFVEDLALWDRLGVRQVGLLASKVEAYGVDDAIEALRQRGMRATTVIGGGFHLADPDSWAGSRASVLRAIDLAAEVGGCTYVTTGRRDRRSFDELCAAFADAIAPCVEHARSRGVALALEPSLRTEHSFVHSLRDGLDVVDRAGMAIVADIGNCWMERDVEATVRRAGERIAIVQLSDVVIGTPTEPAPGGRVVPGDGDLAIDRFVQAALDGGYTGAFEIELVGPRIEAEGYAAATRRAVARTSELLARVLG